MSTKTKQIDSALWRRDMIADVILPLMEASRLWDQQAFNEPSEERRQAIDEFLEKAETQIDIIRSAIER